MCILNMESANGLSSLRINSSVMNLSVPIGFSKDITFFPLHFFVTLPNDFILQDESKIFFVYFS